jgi:8-oxo-dGTP diphosphatase
MENPVIPVVCALIERAGRVLLAQRPAHKHLALKWEFPGGKVDPGESAEAALIREIKEELLCEITLRRALPRTTHTYGRTTIEMIPFVCSLAPESPEPRPTEHVAVVWVWPAELDAYDLAAADRPVVQKYRAIAGNGSPKPS